MEKDIIFEFSGWCRLDPMTRFVYIGSDEEDHAILASEWADLPKHKQAEYILEDAIAAIRDSEDLEYTEMNLCLE